ncbi:hypothetical protein EXU57_00805 [Segetibacter sp. 3557_3]|uniref:hypothetical protein n=1 Tax=Segetibacter sp. 3557_3 TaxID=2547429 RepID=UPI001058983F|nr:hypothetical protein [Segetibacter sp. 3557_3]TDH28650.1 hypothetical protein EXU57_00805 [Segetibacter sp. 3557_3]
MATSIRKVSPGTWKHFGEGEWAVFPGEQCRRLGRITTISQSARFLSPEWIELLKYSMKEAYKLNLEFGFNLCAG